MSNTVTDSIHRREKLSKWFFRFSEQTAGSEMYQFLSKKISQDIELLDLASHSDPTQPVPNLFLAAVNFLLYKNKNHELATCHQNGEWINWL